MPRKKETVNLVFQPSGLRGRVEAGLTILDAARSLGEEMETPCGAR